MAVHQRDLGAGLSFLAVAAIYGSVAHRDLPLGAALSMGPGYFPAILCGLLAVIGTVLTVRALRAGRAVALAGRFAWRPGVIIGLSILLFGTFLRELGLFLGVFCTALLCSLASPQTTWRRSALMSLGLAVICTGVFAYGVRLPLPVVGSWIMGW